MASSRMTALLALLAIAGYQNRDRLGEMLGRVTGSGSTDGARPDAPPSNAGGLGGLLGGLFGGGGAGQGLSGGLADLIANMSGNGHAETADSWVKTGPNKELAAPDLASALGDDTIEQLTGQTGLSREELLSRLQSVLPTAVDRLTPQGRLPTEADSSAWKV
jgi:uncharacterized protein YidB (DUF937 family)